MSIENWITRIENLKIGSLSSIHSPRLTYQEIYEKKESIPGQSNVKYASGYVTRRSSIYFCVSPICEDLVVLCDDWWLHHCNKNEPEIYQILASVI
jgi:hypothetical protein